MLLVHQQQQASTLYNGVGRGVYNGVRSFVAITIPGAPTLYARSIITSVDLEMLENLEMLEDLELGSSILEDTVNSYNLTVESGSTPADLMVKMPDNDDIRTITGTDNAIYDTDDDPIAISWVDLQDYADDSDYLFVGRRGIVLYSTDMSADEVAIMRFLGGLYVAPVTEYATAGAEALTAGAESLTLGT